MTLQEQIENDLGTVGAASAARIEALGAFQLACRRRDWELAEALRSAAIIQFEIELDAYIAAMRRMEVMRGTL